MELESYSQRRETIRMQSALAEITGLDEKLLRIAPQMDRFEGYAEAHGQRIESIVDLLGAAFNLASRDRFFLRQAALVHDVGEMKMNREYIKSTQILTTEERLDLQRHPVIGEQETAKMGLPRGVQLLVRWHHEWWNGNGYPDGLVAEHDAVAEVLRQRGVAGTFVGTANGIEVRAVHGGGAEDEVGEGQVEKRARRSLCPARLGIRLRRDARLSRGGEGFDGH